MDINNPAIISETRAGRLCVYWDDYKANNFLHIRLWYHDKANDVWKPGVKGIAIREIDVPKFLEALKSVLQGKLNDGE